MRFGSLSHVFDPHRGADNKPIYINQPATPKLGSLVAILLEMNPDLKDRIFHLTWDDSGKVNIVPYAESEILKNTSDLGESGKLAEAADRVLSHVPVEGELYEGAVIEIVEYGVWVGILPGVEGFIHSSEVPGNIEVGSPIYVVITEINRDGFRMQPIAEETVREREMQPVFLDARALRLLK